VIAVVPAEVLDALLDPLLASPAVALPHPAATMAVAAAPTIANRIRLLVLNIVSSVIVWLLPQLCDDGVQWPVSGTATHGKGFGKLSSDSAM
jgi:hypothetical protein